MKTELIDLIDQVLAPKPPYYNYWRRMSDLTKTERAVVISFCREGFAELGLKMPPRFSNRHDPHLIASMIRRIIRGYDVSNQTFYMLAVVFHPDIDQRKCFAAKMGYLWDDRSGRVIADFGGRVEGGVNLDDVGYLTGRA
jgi:hypothetical protein